MDNKEIALQLTVAALNNGVIRISRELPDELVTEPIIDFYFSILESIDSMEEN